MPYRVKPNWKKADGTTSWRLIWECYENGVRKFRHVPVKERAAKGFPPTLTIEEAKERARQLNTQAELHRQEERRNRIDERLRREEKVESAWLPPTIADEFAAYLRRRFQEDGGDLMVKKIDVHWRSVKKLIRAVALEPTEWADQPEVIYRYFAKNKLSLEYTKSMLRILNLWGFFYCKKLGRPFLPVPAPRGVQRSRIADAYYDKRPAGQESAPISPEELENAKPNLIPEQYNWLFVSVWFGLRPAEIDSLKRPNTWRLELSDGKSVLCVYQAKLTGIAREKRWKKIPVLFPQQEAALTIIRSGALKRPLPKTIKRWVKDGARAYGGRKGFEALMVERHGFAIETVAAWLGHQNINTTWRKYRDAGLVRTKKSS
jgi:integrase